MTLSIPRNYWCQLSCSQIRFIVPIVRFQWFQYNQLDFELDVVYLGSTFSTFPTLLRRFPPVWGQSVFAPRWGARRLSGGTSGPNWIDCDWHRPPDTSSGNLFLLIQPLRRPHRRCVGAGPATLVAKWPKKCSRSRMLYMGGGGHEFTPQLVLSPQFIKRKTPCENAK